MSIQDMLTLPNGEHRIRNERLGREVKVFRTVGYGVKVMVEYGNWTARLISYNEQGEYLGQEYLGKSKNSRIIIAN